MSNHYGLIWSEEELRKMHSLMPRLKEDEVYFIALSARAKYLTEEEKKIYQLGKMELFNRKIIKDDSFETLVRTVKGFETSHGSYMSGNDLEIPASCLSCYFSVVVKSSSKALKGFYDETLDQLMQKKPPKSLDSILMTAYHRASNGGNLIDIDFDVPKGDGFSLLEEYVGKLREKGVALHVVETRTGFHLLLERSSLKFNYNTLISEASEKATKLFGKKSEVTRNMNEMLALPGTIQAGHKVKFIDV